MSDFLLLFYYLYYALLVYGGIVIKNTKYKLGTFKHKMWLSSQRKAPDGVFSLFPKGPAQYHHGFLLMAFIYILTHKNRTSLVFTGGIKNE